MADEELKIKVKKALDDLRENSEKIVLPENEITACIEIMQKLGYKITSAENKEDKL